MAQRIVISIAVVAFLAACNPTRPDMMAPKVTNWQDCSTTGGTSGNPAKCKVAVTVEGRCPGADITYDKPDLSLSGSGNALIVWQLKGANFEFCPAQGDGVFLKFVDVTDQFGDPAATDDPEGGQGSATSKCKKFFRLRDDNKASTTGKTYQYRIQFTDRKNNTSCTADPQIRNG